MLIRRYMTYNVLIHHKSPTQMNYSFINWAHGTMFRVTVEFC